jgi:GWxTD domain-containing protein
VRSLQDTTWIILTLLLLAPSGIGRLAAQDPSAPKSMEPMSERHRQWIERDVTYIISDAERRVFQQLTTERLRNLFVEAFWRQRDPTPVTADNEYQEEHYRRLSYANTWFGNRKTEDGWRSDRGRIYILLGDPQERTKFTGQNDIRDLEIWFYDSQQRIKTIPFFRLLFYQKSFAHDYVLYSPNQDGPQELAMQIAPTRAQALRYLKVRAGQEVWQAAQTCIPTEPLGAAWSPQSDILMSKVENLPNTLFDSTWAENFLITRGRVKARLSFRRSNLRQLTCTLFNASRQAFVHTGMEIRPEDLRVGEIDGRYFAVFDIKTFVEDTETQREVLTREDHWESVFEFRDGQVVARPVAFEQVLPLVPGRYRILWVLDDLITETFDFREAEITIAGPQSSEPQITVPLLTRGYEKLNREAAFEIRPFRIFNLQYHPDFSGQYNRGDNLSVFFEFLYPVESGKPLNDAASFNIEVRPIGRDGVDPLLFHHNASADQLTEGGILFVHRQIPVTQLEPGEYELTVRASYPGTEGSVAQGKVSFSYKGEEIVVRPKPAAFVTSPSRLSTTYLLYRSRQFESMDRIDEAIEELQKAVQKNSGNLELESRLSELIRKREASASDARK